MRKFVEGDPPLIIYHANCPDGFTAAWVARKYFLTRTGVEPEFVAANHGDAPPDVRGRSVYVLDFSYPRDVLEWMYADACNLLVLDHHKSAEEDLRGLHYARFDMERSGAGMAWDHFFEGQPRPLLVDLVEDRDLWRFELPESKALNAFIGMHPRTIEAWDDLHMQLSEYRHYALRAGQAVLVYQDQLAGRIAKRADVYEIDTATVWDSAHAWKKVVAVNTPILQSEVLAKLYAEHPEAATFAWSQFEDQILVSFRSKPGDGPDVGRIAESFGGGGHKHAAGCAVSVHRWAAHSFAREVAALAKAWGEVGDE